MLEPDTGPLRQPHADALREDYAIIQLQPARLQNGKLLLARELIESHGALIAQNDSRRVHCIV